MMSPSKCMAVLSMAGALAWSGALCAQADSAAMAAGGDAHFVAAASSAGDTEIIASRLAQQNAQSPQIKNFAATMVRDHTAANDKLRTIAQKNGMPLAGVAAVQQQPALLKLQNLHGADFDKAYADMMRSDHQEAVTLFTNESSSGTNPALKAFAAQTLPTLQHHLEMAQSLK